MKTPEQYFMENVNPPGEGVAAGDLTPTEKAFLEKYVGVGQKELLAGVRRVDPVAEPGLPSGRPRPVQGAVEPPFSLDEYLKAHDEIQLVSFFVEKVEYSLPITIIQEVIRLVPWTKLPKAPPFVAGVINLRGRVTLLLALRKMLHRQTPPKQQDRFIVVCRHKGLQVGFLVDAVATMYKVARQNIELNVDTRMGGAEDYVMGLIKAAGERLIGILSIDSLVDGVALD